jgi:hypothetical protein
MIEAVAGLGWPPFTELTELLSNTNFYEFIEDLPGFASSPNGLSVINALVYWGGEGAIKVLYNNRNLVNDVKLVGDRYLQKYSQCSEENGYEALADDAAKTLAEFRS